MLGQKPQHRVVRRVNLGARGHSNVKLRRPVTDLAIGFVSSYPTFYLLGLQASARERPTARDRRGSLFERASVKNSGLESL
jgi:hypothetical protein